MPFVTINIDNGKFGKQVQDIVIKKVNGFIERSGFLSPDQNKGIATGLTKILRNRLIHNNGEYNKTGQASLNLLNTAEFVRNIRDSSITGEGESSQMTTVFNIEMPKYGFIIGAKEGFDFTPNLNNLVKWMKDKMGRGVSFYYTQTTTRKNAKATIQKPLTASSTDKEFKRGAYGIRAGKKYENAGGKNVVLPDWYKITDEQLSFQVNRIAGILKRNLITKINSNG